MTSKWQSTWNYYGWKEYLTILPERDTFQNDWNSTFVTRMNEMRVKILEDSPNVRGLIVVAVHPSLYASFIKTLLFLNVKNGKITIGTNYTVNLDASLDDDKVYVYGKDTDSIGEITIDYVKETRE
jgi:hypothetical protein